MSDPIVRRRARGLALAALSLGACRRSEIAVTRDRTEAAPRPAPSPSTAPELPDAFTSTPLPADCSFGRVFTSDAWLTLAFVRARAIERDEGQCDVTEDGARWITLGTFGERVGEVERVTTPTEGNGFRLVAGTNGADVYVRGAVPRFVSYAWVPSTAEESALRTLVASTPTRRFVFFRSGGGLRFAAVEEGRGLSLFEQKGGSYWDRVQRSEEPSVAWRSYELRAVLDLDDDEVPEVVEHFNEYADGRGFEIVAQRTSSGVWDEVADNEDTGP